MPAFLAPTFFDYFMVFLLLTNAALVFNLTLLPQHLPTLSLQQPLPLVVPSDVLEAALSCCVHPLHGSTHVNDHQCSETVELTF